MTSYFFSAYEGAERLKELGGDSATVYQNHQAQDWTRAILDNVDGSNPSNFHLTIDFLADVVVGTVLGGGRLMSIDAADQSAFYHLTAEAQASIDFVYPPELQ